MVVYAHLQHGHLIIKHTSGAANFAMTTDH
jgi:hypothetical protein